MAVVFSWIFNDKFINVFAGFHEIGWDVMKLHFVCLSVCLSISLFVCVAILQQMILCMDVVWPFICLYMFMSVQFYTMVHKNVALSVHIFANY